MSVSNVIWALCAILRHWCFDISSSFLLEFRHWHNTLLTFSYICLNDLPCTFFFLYEISFKSFFAVSIETADNIWVLGLKQWYSIIFSLGIGEKVSKAWYLGLFTFFSLKILQCLHLRLWLFIFLFPFLFLSFFCFLFFWSWMTFEPAIICLWN